MAADLPKNFFIKTQNGLCTPCQCKTAIHIEYKNLIWHLPLEDFYGFYALILDLSQQTGPHEKALIKAGSSLMAQLSAIELQEIHSLLEKVLLEKQRSALEDLYQR